jgi:serine/threonine-protein kinase
MESEQDTLGIYALQRRIGRGGMGSVFLAEDTSLHRPVALKLLPPELAADPDYVARFEREATTLAAIRHPNLVHIYAVGHEGGRHYIAMEFLEGRTIAEALREQGELPPERAVHVVAQVLDALDSVHAAGVVHRDIKPGNIMGDRAVLMDFGLAKPRGDRSVTTGHEIIGTAEYMAPEVAEGNEASPQSDLYALGVVLFEMLTGEVPFKGASAIATLRKHVEQPVPSVCAAAPGVPERFEGVLARTMAKDPAARYGSAQEMAAHLLSVVDSPVLRGVAVGSRATAATMPLPQSGSRKGPSPVPRRRSWLLVAAGMALGVAAAVAAVIAIPRLRKAPRPAPATTPEPAPTGQDPAPPSAASQSLFLVAVRGRPALRGRIVTIEGEGGDVVVRTADGDVRVPYGQVQRIAKIGE